MNVDDVTTDAPVATSEEDRLSLIFNRQRELMDKYHHIEQDNGLLQTELVPVGIHDRFGQARLKDFAWRVTEELGEAMMAGKDHPELPQHKLEELADAYHFLVELTILSGWTDVELFLYLMGEGQWSIQPHEDRLKIMFYHSHPTKNVPSTHDAWQVVEALSGAMNTLKQKPWKQTHLLTDVEKYRKFLAEAHIAFYRLCRTSGMKAEGLFEMYFKKSEVNKFRQRSNY